MLPLFLLLLLVAPEAWAVPDSCDGDGPLPSVLQAADVDATIRGPVGARTGTAVALADLDADGILDLVVGVPDHPGWSSGIAVFFGPVEDPGALQLDAADLILRGGVDADAAGTSLHAAGDLTGDGLPDLVVGSLDDVVFVVGSRPSWPASMDLADAADVTLLGPLTGDGWGTTLADGDLDGDGFLDLAIGAPAGDGVVSIFAGPLQGVLTPTSAAIVVLGSSDSGLGAAIVADDVDEDGIDDLWVGAPGANQGHGLVAWVDGGLFVSGTFTLGSSSIIVSGTTDWRIGTALASGAGRLYLGAPEAGVGGEVRGFAYVHAQTTTGGLISDIPGPLWTGAPGDGFGAAVVLADTDGQGILDLVVGAPDGGVVYVHGSMNGAAHDGAAHRIEGPAGSGLGTAIAAGDSDRDGFDDLWLGGPRGDGLALWQRGGGDVYDEDTAYVDADGDGVGDVETTVCPNTLPAGVVTTGGDCDDTRADTHPGAPETCADASDLDCDGLLGPDADGDGFGACEDCDDADDLTHPGADERCDGRDNNCDGEIDERPVDGHTWYADGDGDGYGAPFVSTDACTVPAGYVADARDCDDVSPSSAPGGAEVCDGRDNDCDGTYHLMLHNFADDVQFSSWTGGGGDARFGASTAVADVNGDGLPDLLVAEPGGAGHVAVRLGPFTDRRYRGVADADLVISGLVPDAGFGDDLVTGDFDGDGQVDIAVGAPAAEQGAVYVFLGPISTDLSTADADLVITGPHPGARLGETLLAHDLDRDGIDDLVVTSPDADGIAGAVTGAAFVLLGPRSPGVFDVGAIATTWLEGAASDGLGTALAVGDLNGDGWPDLAVGAAHATAETRAAAGYVDVVLDVAARSGLVEPDVHLLGRAAHERLGIALALVDLDLDGLDDLQVGTGVNLIWTIYGEIVTSTLNTTGEILVDEPGAGGDLGSQWRRWFASAGANAGETLEAADVDGDGHDDLVAGASRFDATGFTDSGALWVFYATPSARRAVSGALGMGQFARHSGRFNARVVHRVGNAGMGDHVTLADVDGDGDHDIVVSASRSGSVYLFLSDPRGIDIGAGCVLDDVLVPDSCDGAGVLATVLDRSDLDGSIAGAPAGARAGAAVAFADMNVDGVPDLVVGAPGHPDWSSGVAVFFGPVPDGRELSLDAADLVLTGATDATSAGAVLLAAPDLTGDGLPDLVVGSPDERVFIISGRPSWPADLTLSAAADAIVAGPPAGYGWGRTFVAADLDGDGSADLAIGSPGGDGSVAVFAGPLQGALAHTSAAAVVTGSVGDRLGSALAADDVDGDGIVDLWIGAPGAGAGRGLVVWIPGPRLAGTLGRSTAPFELTGTLAAPIGQTLAAGDGRVYVGSPSAGEVRSVGYEDAAAHGGGPVGTVADELWTGQGRFGATLALADLDGGGTDLLVSAPDHLGRGVVYAFDAQRGDADLDATHRILGFPGDGLGTALAVADLDDDGYDDLLLGAPFAGSEGGVVAWLRGGSEAYDEGTGYVDGDGDGFGGVAIGVCRNQLPAGTVLTGGDCDDARDDVFPGAPETCLAEEDLDCNGVLGPTDADGDGFGCDDCDDNVRSIHPGSDEQCNGLDDDCDGVVDEDAIDLGTWYRDDDGDGHGDPASRVMACDAPTQGNWTELGDDCAPLDPRIAPDGDELCDGIDNDCNGAIDDHPLDGRTFYRDRDRDGHGDPFAPVDACTQPRSASTRPTDCDDDDASVHPRATEVCNGRDDDCDGQHHLMGSRAVDQSPGDSDEVAFSRWSSEDGAGFGGANAVADVDGDGTMDLLVGQANEASGPGRVAVRLGPFADWRYRGVEDADLVLEGDAGTRSFGTDITTGDFDGDGHTDIAVSAPLADAAKGALYVFFGPLTSSVTAAEADVTVFGATADAGLGGTLHAADLDGDGITDLVVTAPGAASGAGLTFLVLGPLSPGSGGISSFATAWIRGEPDAAHGTSIATGDIDGDGWPDLAVGAASGMGGSVEAGYVDVIFGAGSRVGPIDVDVRVLGDDAAAGAGTSVAIVDIDLDGQGDLWIGTGANEIWTIWAETVISAAEGSGQLTLVPEDLGPSWRSWWAGGNANAGEVLAVADVDGDGHDDLVAGASEFDRSTLRAAGGIWIFYATPRARFPGPGEFIMGQLERHSGRFNARISGRYAGTGLGADLALADVDGDGDHDIVAGAPDSDQVYLFLSDPRGVDLGAECDTDGDGCIDDIDLLVDALEGDMDGDGISDVCDPCGGNTPQADLDDDGICDDEDPCLGAFALTDANADGVYDCVEPAVEVSVGRAHTCAVGVSDRLECWGSDTQGEALPWRAAPIGAVAAGDRFTCALGRVGDIACFGRDSHGQAPTRVLGPFVDLTAGGNHACGLREDGHVTCWGDDTHGQAPTAWIGPFVEVSAGGAHTCALRATGDVDCRGLDALGQASPPLRSFVSIDAGSRHTCGVMADGTASCWGDDRQGQSTPPAGQWAALSIGDGHGCGLRRGGVVECWGAGASPLPADAADGRYTSIDAGWGTTCGVVDGGAVRCWTLGATTSFDADLELCYGDPHVGDLDRDGICDDLDDDVDGDGLTTAMERALGTYERVADTDQDGLDDGVEVDLGTDPTDFDTDDDGLLDGLEGPMGGDPLDPDSDDDGLLDGAEVHAGTDLRSADTDGDGLSDRVEVEVLGTDPLRADGDGDGLTDLEEVTLYGTDPRDPDTDNDGLVDGDEISGGTDPIYKDDGYNADDSARHSGDTAPHTGDTAPHTGDSALLFSHTGGSLGDSFGGETGVP